MNMPCLHSIRRNFSFGSIKNLHIHGGNGDELMEWRFDLVDWPHYFPHLEVTMYYNILYSIIKHEHQIFYSSCVCVTSLTVQPIPFLIIFTLSNYSLFVLYSIRHVLAKSRSLLGQVKYN